MSQKLLVNGFEWVKELSKFNKDFNKTHKNECDEDSSKGYFLEVDVGYPKYLFYVYGDIPFLPERNKIKKSN